MQDELPEGERDVEEPHPIRAAIDTAKREAAESEAHAQELRLQLEVKLKREQELREELQKLPTDIQNIARKKLKLPLISKAPAPLTPVASSSPPLPRRVFTRPAIPAPSVIEPSSLLEIRQIADLIAKKHGDSNDVFQRVTELLHDAYSMCVMHPRDRHGIPVPPHKASSQSERWVTAAGARDFLQSRLVNGLDLTVRSEAAEPDKASQSSEKATSAYRADEVLRKADLIRQVAHEWPSVDKDLSEASRNGLREAAHGGGHGLWRLEKARAWAKENGRLKQSTAPFGSSAPWVGGVTTRKLR